MKSKQIKLLKSVVKLIRENWGGCEMNEREMKKKIHYPSHRCASCRAGLCIDFLDEYILQGELKEKK